MDAQPRSSNPLRLNTPEIGRLSHLLSLDGRNHLPRMLCIPKLQKPDPLPGSRIQPSIRNRNRHARPNQRALHMCRHIVAAFRIVPIQPLPAPFVLGNDPVQSVGHVGAHVAIVVLIEREGAGRVLNEEGQKAGLVVGDFGEGRGDVRGYEVGAAATGGEGEGLLEPGCDISCHIKNYVEKED